MGKYNISTELLMRYSMGDTNEEETLKVIQALNNDPELRELYENTMSINEYLAEMEESADILPMMRLAATHQHGLCDVLCEEAILQTHGVELSEIDIPAEARENRWLYEEGTPLHQIGRILEKHGFIVERQFNASITDISFALGFGFDVIVVVSNPQLSTDTEKEDDVNHAILVLSIDHESSTLMLCDPSQGNATFDCPFEQFEDAWKSSYCYLVTAREADERYTPRPIDVSDVELTDDILAIREAIAENAHDVWAQERMNTGWTYGPERNDKKKETPDLIPYSQLPEGEKEFDRIMALSTIKLMKKLGYDIVKHKNTAPYQMMLKRMEAAGEVHRCPTCEHPIFRSQNYCEHCGRKLSYKDFE